MQISWRVRRPIIKARIIEQLTVSVLRRMYNHEACMFYRFHAVCC